MKARGSVGKVESGHSAHCLGSQPPLPRRNMFSIGIDPGGNLTRPSSIGEIMVYRLSIAKTGRA
jgi:hypothetical protein